jgi:hypothetical protein
MASEAECKRIQTLKLAGTTDQAIGRNSGWRSNGGVSIGVVDAGEYKGIVRKMQYVPAMTDCAVPWVVELKEIIGDISAWFYSREYDANSLVGDFDIKKTKTVQDYRRLLRLLRSLRSDTIKTEREKRQY